MLPGTAFEQHGFRGLSWGWGGGESRVISGDPFSPNTIRCHDVPSASVEDPAALNPWPCPHAPRDAICSAWVLGTCGGPGEYPAIHSHQMPFVDAMYRVLLQMILLLFALRLTGPRAQFLAMPACFRECHLHGMRPLDFIGAREISVAPNASRCRDVPDAPVDDPGAFCCFCLNSLPCPHAPRDGICPI